MDDREQLKTYLEDFAREYLVPSRKAGKNMYCCPLCNSGTGRNRTGALSIFRDAAGSPRWKCHACGVGGDIFNLISAVKGIDIADSFHFAREAYGNRTNNQTREEPITHKKQMKHDAQEAYSAQTDYTAYIRSCQESLKANREAQSYLQSRGISESTADRFQLGYDEESRSIVIPYGRKGNYYTRRSIDKKAYRKPPASEAGPQPLYNRAALYNQSGLPIFVVEGEIDALSVIEAGGYAVALCGAQNGRKLLQEIEDKKPTGTIVLSLDNDTTGETAAAGIAEDLKELQIPYILANITGRYKDANEALVADRDGLVKSLRRTIEQAKEIDIQKAEEEKANYQCRSSIAFIKQFTEDIANSAVNTIYIPTGYDSLDETLDGGLYEGLYIIGAISSLGKTTFVIQAADQIAAAGHDVLIFSLEMARSEIMAKSISRETYLHSMECCSNATYAKTTREITTGKRWRNYSQTEVEAIKSAISRYAGYAGNIYITEGIGDIGAVQIRDDVSEHIRITGNKPVIIVDYLQLLAPYDPRSTDKQNMDKAVLELKRISRDFKVSVIAISSLNRQSYNSQISMEAFKETGAIEYSSDVLIGLQARGAGSPDFNVDEAKQKDPREIELKILKNRNGRTGDKLSFEYFPRFNYFRESLTLPSEQKVRARR